MFQRDSIFQMRVADEEREMLRELAEKDGLSSSDVVRLLIRRAHAEAFGGRRVGSASRPKKAAKRRI